MIGCGRSGARLAAAVLVAAVALFLGGCVYLRLLELKHQLAAFDRNFTLETEQGVRITCLHPVLLSKDVRWIGLEPEHVKKIGTAEQWQVRWVKQLPDGVKESGAFDIVLELTFSEDKLQRAAIPERYFAVMPKSFLVDLIKSLGSGKVDRSKRSVEAQLAGSRPDLPGIEKLLGVPSARSVEGEETVYRYRYVPVSTRASRRPAIFDMAVHFDTNSGQLLRWQGLTPVGKIGFDFTSTPPPPSTDAR